MDEHDDHPERPQQPLHPHDVPPAPPATSTWWAMSPADHPTRSRRRPRLLAAGTAAAVLVAAGGAGFALGHWNSGSTRAGAPPASRFGGRLPQGGNTEPFGGTPFSGPDQGNGSPFSTSGGTPATSGQLTGLVRVAVTLKYQGGRAAGTGMVLTPNGEVITNHHVVEGATGIRVTVMSTGTTYAASVVGTDPKDDVAVLQLKNASGLATVTTATNGVGVGDAVTAVGDAGGSTTAFSAARGKVVATGQHITTHSIDGHATESLNGLVEISSDVISGDSGGATYDAQGHVVGMTTAASTGGNVVGYAIPIAKVLRIATALEHQTQNARYTYGPSAFLGIGLHGSGTTVGEVFRNTPAATAGIVPGDTITWIGRSRVHTAAGLRRAITSYSPGARVRVAWTDRPGVTHIGTVRLIAGPVA